MIEQVTPQSAIDAYIKQKIEAYKKVCRRRVEFACRDAVNAARNSDAKSRDWKDQTGNLRSSIGYVISENGTIVGSSAFAAVKEGGEGSSKGRTLAQSLAASGSGDMNAVVVAGMHYAKYLAAKGYDVLDSAEITLRNRLEQFARNGLK